MRQILEHGIIIRNSDLSVFQPILLSWIRNVKSYCDCFPGERGDAPYWHEERVNVSVLASAIWGAGGVALEEYPASRGQSGGRVDIWCRWASENYVIEAKQIEFHVERDYPPQHFIAKVDNAVVIIKAAFSQLREPRGHFLGVVFAVPTLYNVTVAEIDDLLRVVQRGLSDGRHDLLAWVFPKATRALKYRKVYPGVMLVGMDMGGQVSKLKIKK